MRHETTHIAIPTKRTESKQKTALGVDDFLFDVTYNVSGETCDGCAVVVNFFN